MLAIVVCPKYTVGNVNAMVTVQRHIDLVDLASVVANEFCDSNTVFIGTGYSQ